MASAGSNHKRNTVRYADIVMVVVSILTHQECFFIIIHPLLTISSRLCSCYNWKSIKWEKKYNTLYDIRVTIVHALEYFLLACRLECT